MRGLDFFFIFPLLVGFGFFVAYLLSRLDKGKITAYIEERGGQVLELHYTPFGPGWFFEKGERIFSITYEDREGNIHEAHCKTHLLTGNVYFLDDEIVERVGPVTSGSATETVYVRELKREIEELRAENQLLRRQLEQATGRR